MDRKSRPENYVGKEEQMEWNEGGRLSKAHNRIPQTLTVCHVTRMALFALKVSSPR